MDRFGDAAAVVDRILDRVGRRVVVGTPLGLGKANRILDELYRRACDDPGIELDIVTALTLAPPEPGSELERRLLDPIAERLFGGYPVPAFERDVRRDAVPDNVRVRSFFFEPGSALRSRHAQRNHLSVNYADAGAALRDLGVNVVAQLVAPGADGRLSLSSNPDLTGEALDALTERRKAGEPTLACAEVNRNLPYMVGDAELDAAAFDVVLDTGRDFALVGPPKRPIDLDSHLIGLHASSLVRDGGTIQIGIGALADAIVWMLQLRHVDNPAYRRLLDAAGAGRWSATIDRLGGTGPFYRGLYACSEMLVDGFLDLMDAGVLRRRAYDDVETQRVADGAAAGAGEAPAGGHVAHAAFFLGPRSFYERLRVLPDAERDLIGMSGVRFTNTLAGDRALKVAQRRDARFLNTAMQVTLLGATLSDAVEPARVVSGIGGQADFVSMAHALPGGRSVTLLRATRDRGRVTSNIVWEHGHVTIPRQNRDIVVTQYGVADIRGRSDDEVAAALIEIADSRFQDGLVAAARAAGKLPPGYRVPDHARANVPERLARDLATHRVHLPELPFGSDITPVEVALTRALRHVQHVAGGRRWRDLDVRDLRAAATGPPPEGARPHLERMGLDRPRSWRERAWQRIVVYGLGATGALDGATDEAGA